MSKHSLFLSIVCVLQNKESECKEIINNISKVITNLTDDYELIDVDNSSKDKTIKILEELTCGNAAVKNLQVFSLTNEVDKNIASWAGVENSLGDYVITLDPEKDDINFIPKILEIPLSVLCIHPVAPFLISSVPLGLTPTPVTNVSLASNPYAETIPLVPVKFTKCLQWFPFIVSVFTPMLISDATAPSAQVTLPSAVDKRFEKP